MFHLNAETKRGSRAPCREFWFQFCLKRFAIWKSNLGSSFRIYVRACQLIEFENDFDWNFSPRRFRCWTFLWGNIFLLLKKSSNEFTQHERSINDRNDIHERSAMWSRASLSAGYTRNEWKIFDQPSQLSFVRDQRRSHAASIIFPIKKSRGKEENLPGSIRRYFFSPKNRKMLYNIREAGCLRSVLFFILFSFVELLQKRYLREAAAGSYSRRNHCRSKNRTNFYGRWLSRHSTRLFSPSKVHSVVVNTIAIWRQQSSFFRLSFWSEVFFRVLFATDLKAIAALRIGRPDGNPLNPIY